MKKLLSLLLMLCLCMTCMIPAIAESEGVYVLMNIPYTAFYAAEVDVAPTDAVSSATLMKPRAGALAGGSYHVDPEGSDISGVIFPVYVEDASALAGLGGVEITDDSNVEITVTLKGEEQTATYAGRDALFEAPSYSWYVLDEQPALYKTLEMGDTPSFTAINGEAAEIEATASIIYDKHADIVVKVDGLDDALGEDTPVSGIVLIADDGTKVGLRHLANFWRRAQIGMRLDDEVYAALKGKRIDAIEYITTDGLYRVDTDIPVIEDERLIALAGTYIELFPEFAREDMKDYWMECIRAWNVDDEAAEGYYQMLTGMFMGKLYGQEAVDAYSEHPEAMLFDCYFENGVAKFTIAGDEISGVDAEGNELFRHAYAYVDDMTVTYFGQEMENYLHIYKTEDADAGIFTYFAFSDDTLAETQHIEFRYGETLDDMANYSEGQYAYWLASGTLDGYKDSLLQDCIKLFVDENVGEAQAEAGEGKAPAESGVENNTDRFVGRWSLNVADYPAFAEEGLTDGTITLEFLPDGTASTYYNDMQTSTYGYFTYMNYYVAVTPDGEAESSLYTFSDDGLTLTLTDMNGEWELAYHKVDDSAPVEGEQAAVIEIATAEELAAINDNLSGNYVLTADIDLSGYDSFPMIGTYVMDENSAEGEDPIPEMAFTGSFDGNGHTISNLNIDASEDMAHMFGVGLFACVAEGGSVRNVTLQNVNVKGMMLVGGAVGYAFHCTVDNVDLGVADPKGDRNTLESTMVMVGGVVGGLTCSECVNCDVAYTDIIAAPGGNCGILGGGFSKPVLENCTVSNSSLTAVLGEVPMFGMTEGNWIGGLTGCVNLDDYDPAEWYVKNCAVRDTQITVSGKGGFVGGLTGSCGVVLDNAEAPRMLIQGCSIENVSITVSDGVPCVGGFVGGGFSEGDTPHSFLIDGCDAINCTITTDVESLAESSTGLLIGMAAGSQFMGTDGTIVDIADTAIDAETINSTADVSVIRVSDNSEYADVTLVGQVVTAE